MTLQKKNKVKGNNVEKDLGDTKCSIEKIINTSEDIAVKLLQEIKHKKESKKNCPHLPKKKKKKLNLIGALTRNVLYFRRRNGNKSRKQKDGK